MIILRWLLRHTSFQSTRKLCSTGTTEELVTKSVNGKQIVILNRPKLLNSVNMNMLEKLHHLLKKWNSDPTIPFILVKGAGDKAFCAGGDVVALSRSAQTNDPANMIYKTFFRKAYAMCYLIGVLKVPYIAIIDGITMGGGCGISINGKYRIATERTVLAMPEAALGFFPDTGGTFFLSRLPYSLGQFMALTGYRVEGADVYHMGLATHYVPSERLEELETELLDANNKSLSLEKIDQILSKYQLEENKIPKFRLEKRLAQIDHIFSGTTIESVFKKLRNDEDDFGRKHFSNLNKMSPLSLKVTFRQLRVGSKMQFAEVFPLEYRLSQRFMKDHDFHEGCRAILIDKDRKPKWKPTCLEEVTDEMVDKYFAPLPSDEEFVIEKEI